MSTNLTLYCFRVSVMAFFSYTCLHCLAAGKPFRVINIHSEEVGNLFLIASLYVALVS